MKKLRPALLLLLIPFAVLAQRWIGEGYTTNVTLTFGDGGTGSISGDCDSLGSTDGLDLNMLTGYRVVLAVPALADAGQPSLAGGGSALCCVRSAINSGTAEYSANTSDWMRCKTSLDITSIPEGQVSYAEPDFTTSVGTGRVAYVPSAVTSDGGISLRVTLIGQKGPRVK